MNFGKRTITVVVANSESHFLQNAVQAALKAYREHQAAEVADMEHPDTTPLLVG